MKLIKNVQNVTSLVANKKQETLVRSYFYLLFHCTTSCSWHTQSLNKIYYWDIFHETVATAFNLGRGSHFYVSLRRFMIFINFYFDKIGFTYLLAIYYINYWCLTILQAEELLQYLFILIVFWYCTKCP